METVVSRKAPSLIGIAKPLILRADIGGTWMRVVANQKESFKDVEVDRYPTPQTYESFLNRLVARATVALDGKRPDAVGFGIAGQLSGGIMVKAGKLTEYGFVGQYIGQDVADMLEVDRARVADMNDTHAAAKGEQVARRNNGTLKDVEAIYTLSTGFGGARFTADRILPDEPGHHFLREGAMCGCGQNGCLEAHVSGSGIERKFGIRGEHIPRDDDRWAEVTTDLIEGVTHMLNRYETDGEGSPQRLSFFGSVALKGPGVFRSLQDGLYAVRGASPEIDLTAYGGNNGLYGAYFAAQETLQTA